MGSVKVFKPASKVLDLWANIVSNALIDVETFASLTVYYPKNLKPDNLFDAVARFPYTASVAIKEAFKDTPYGLILPNFISDIENDIVSSNKLSEIHTQVEQIGKIILIASKDDYIPPLISLKGGIPALYLPELLYKIFLRFVPLQDIQNQDRVELEIDLEDFQVLTNIAQNLVNWLYYNACELIVENSNHPNLETVIDESVPFKPVVGVVEVLEYAPKPEFVNVSLEAIEHYGFSTGALKDIEHAFHYIHDSLFITPGFAASPENFVEKVMHNLMLLDKLTEA